MRWIFRIVGALAVFVFLAVAAFLLIPTERIARLATDRIAEATGRDVTISGDVNPVLWPDLGVEIQGLQIGNGPWSDEGPMLQAEQVDVAIAWAGLFSGDIRVRHAEVSGAEILLVREADGRASWVFDDAGGEIGPEPSEADGGTAMQFGFDRADITDSRVRYIDREADTEWDVSDLNALVSLPDADGVVSISANGAVNGITLETRAAVNGLSGLLAGEIRPVRAELVWQGGTAEFDGRMATDATMEGALTLDATNLGPLAALGGVVMPDLPRGLGRDRVAVEGQVTRAQEGSIHLRQGRLRLDETALNVALDLVPGEDRPMLRGTITGGAIALPGLLDAGGGGQGADRTAPEGWPRDVIDVSGLFASDAELTVLADSLDLGGVELSGIDLRATLTRGRLVFDIARIGTYGGQLAGQFVINGRGGLSVGGDLILADVELQPLLGAMADYDRLQGSGSASLQFLGVGNDLHTIMDGLEGEGDLSLGGGEFLGFDLAGMIRNLDLTHQGDGARTVYDRVTAEFIIRDGVLLNDDLLLDAPWGDVVGEGSADLGAMTLDYQVTPGVMRDEDGTGGVQVPVSIEGPWSEPRIRPDLEALAEQELAEEAARLEEEARQRLAEEQERLEELARTRASDLIGVEIEAGDSPDDIGQALQEGAVSGLQRLIFGGEDTDGEEN